ncbi:MAG: trypsin-like peptidase domain-containing protein [Alphaproteobacteria bacterium]|nr:trypsin-like peptidase domain-containing protein [Alphaproteobacteria bacterium]
MVRRHRGGSRCDASGQGSRYRPNQDQPARPRATGDQARRRHPWRARVYAIGSPLGKAFQGTVSSGVVSATRTVEGLRFIQSDVSITHGSSGGALLDESGAVIGIAVSGVEVGGPVGINFFIPIGDAMDFLNLEQN